MTDMISLYHITLKPLRRGSLSEQTESFYSKQARVYDQFRIKLLHGRVDLYHQIAKEHSGVWVDFGCGTGWCFEQIGDKVSQFSRIYLVDSSPSLLNIARERIAHMGWNNVEVILVDGAKFVPPEGKADIVTFSYSLTMMPDWMGMLCHAQSILRPGGTVGVVDFYVSQKYPTIGEVHHSRLSRFFLPFWFDGGNVFISPDLIRFLDLHFKTVYLRENSGPMPYTPLMKIPYFLYVGTKQQNSYEPHVVTPDSVNVST